ncbi:MULTISPECIES: hypothetical protein [unclassified Methylobacterium]|uniref:hypothetical protein n=1 Tax=unclassified Methylobacterium TaxID=2615210 RepID=UPI00226AC50D|nr:MULTISPECIES: hypothetical protein [unclassified Methylobacterium]
MHITPRTDAELRKLAANPKAGWYVADILAAIERVSSNNNDMIELSLSVAFDGAEGGGRSMRDWLTAVGKGALKLRRACEAIDAVDRYESGHINAADFVGKKVSVRVETEKKRGFADRLIVTDYRTASPSPPRKT